MLRKAPGADPEPGLRQSAKREPNAGLEAQWLMAGIGRSNHVAPKRDLGGDHDRLLGRRGPRLGALHG
jgi:hypothetical protein